MVKSVIKKVKPKHGFSHLFHLLLVASLPIITYVFVRLDFFILAVLMVLVSKWRMFAVSPRHWIPHIRTNAVDIIVSLAIVSFMVAAVQQSWLQLLWLAIFEVWLLIIKPRTSTFFVSMQALVAIALGLSALFLVFKEVPSSVYVIVSFLISYFSSRHFFNSYEEDHAIEYSWVWGFFVACIVWVLSHWLIFYMSVAQPAVLITILAYGLAGIYYLHEHDKLTQMVKRQIIFVVIALIFVIIALSNWGDKVL